ncbi:MAG TPA: hypothetical protein VLR88_00660 [Propionibacteriaceae bacterium]|nr:hypothetical protein [Propionibacteriaceae bacterium]
MTDKIVPADPKAAAQIASAPMPTPKTLRMRSSLPYQFTRYVSQNVRIMRMVIKGHH